MKVSGFHMVMTLLTILCKNDWKVLLFASLLNGTSKELFSWSVSAESEE